MEITKPSPPSAGDQSTFQMVSISEKQATFRRAVACGEIALSRSAFDAVKNRTNPKGDVLAIAEVAGIQATKKTSELIPLCHPIPIEQMRLSFTLDEDRCAIQCFCEVATFAKTGVEMEALQGITGALLAIYDLSKAVDPVITISNIQLVSKEGGKQGHWQHPEVQESVEMQKAHQESQLDLHEIRTAVITVSDRCFSGATQDLSGPALIDALRDSGAPVIGSAIIPDEIPAIRETVLQLIRDEKPDLILCTGGTGVGPRDVTPEALGELFTKPIPGVGEFLRYEGGKHIPFSWLSRSSAGLVGKTLVVALPGSPKGAVESFQALKKLLPHLIRIGQGGRH